MVQWNERNVTILIYSLRGIGMAVGSVLIALGVYYLVSGNDRSTTVDTNTIKNVVLDVYRIIFGLLLIVAELRFKYLLVWFSFLIYYIGLGFFYVFIAGFALGNEWYEYVIAIVAGCVGGAYCTVACCCASVEKSHQEAHRIEAAKYQT